LKSLSDRTRQPPEGVEAEAGVLDDDRTLDGPGGLLALLAADLLGATLVF